MSVKLEVGKWYQLNSGQGKDYAGTFVQCISLTGPYRFQRGNSSTDDWGCELSRVMDGPYSIEPGDVVKPKPAGDKCWDSEGITFWRDRWLDKHKNGGPVYNLGDGGALISSAGTDIRLPLSCLILLEKGAKAPAQAQDFQVGDEVEVLPIGHECWKDVGCDGDGSDPHICHDRDKGVLPIKKDWKDGSRYELIKSCLPAKCLKLIRRAGETSAPAAPLNPRVLPSVSGSELLWSDVRPGIELDKLPEDKTTIEDRDANAWSTQTVSTAKAVLNFLCSVEANLGKTNNADRERIRKIIPEIERKLTQLKGRL